MADIEKTAPEPLAQGDVVAYIESYEVGGVQRSGLVWADHPADTPGHTFKPLYASPPPPAEGPATPTLPVDVRGQWYEVPVPVQLHIVMMREKLNNPATFFADDASLAAWLDGLRATNDDGAVTDEAWEPAQRAAAFLRGELKPATPNPPQPSASVGERARELLARDYDAHSMPETAKLIRNGSPISADFDAALRVIESALTQQHTAAAEHWHGLYRKECRLRQDDAARYGQQIVDLESALTTAAGGGGLRELVVRWRANGHPYVSECADELEAALGRGGAE